MLPNGDALTKVYKEIVPAAAPGTCLIDCSTVDVESARNAHAAAEAAGLLCLDAPVSGGVVGAVQGTLTFMAGGSNSSFKVAELLFNIMGQKGPRQPWSLSLSDFSGRLHDSALCSA